MTPTEVAQRLDFALAASREAARLILGYYRTPDLVVDQKRDRSPVTAADRGAEELLRQRIAERFPDDGLFGEEFGETPGRNPVRWVLDPVDGTKAFIHGVPLFGTLIGLEADGQLLAGVCRFPALNEVIFGGVGQGAWWQIGNETPRRAKVSSVKTLNEAMVCTTSFNNWREAGKQASFDRINAAARETRGWSDCYGHALVITGRADVMLDPLLNPWDAAALVPILREAGGDFFDWTGQDTIHGGNGIATNRLLTREVLSAITEK